MKLFLNYNKVLLLISLITVLPIMGLTVYMEPNSNELTRMGGYLENDYGWNKPQGKFVNPLFTLAKDIQDYDRYYDVVVYGDSFSEDLSHGWQNYLYMKTGLKIITFNMNNIGLESILMNKFYRNSPPKIFIYQSVERNIITRNKVCDPNNISPNKKYVRPKIRIKSREEKIEFINRDKSKISYNGLNVSSTINYIRKSFIRNILKNNITEVHQYSLNTKSLFSNNEPDSLLIITRDFKLKNVTTEDIKIAQCNLLSLQQRIRKNNKTEFVTLFFPDKTTAYTDFIVDKSFADMSIVKKIEQTAGLNSTSLVDIFKKKIHDGVIDFYLPNDTHCGFQAYRIAADAVLARLELVR